MNQSLNNAKKIWQIIVKTHFSRKKKPHICIPPPPYSTLARFKG